MALRIQVSGHSNSPIKLGVTVFTTFFKIVNNIA